MFVQTVEGSALSVVIPLMIAGFRQPKAMVKRMCARIVSNMAKLVEDPLEAKPFLGELIPSLFDVIDTIADPEARDVATKTHAALVVMDKKGTEIEASKRFRQPEVIASFITEHCNTTNEQAAIVDYVASMSAALTRTKTIDQDEWKDVLSPFLTQLGKPDFWKEIAAEAKKVRYHLSLYSRIILFVCVYVLRQLPFVIATYFVCAFVFFFFFYSCFVR